MEINITDLITDLMDLGMTQMGLYCERGKTKLNIEPFSKPLPVYGERLKNLILALRKSMIFNSF